MEVFFIFGKNGGFWVKIFEEGVFQKPPRNTY